MVEQLTFEETPLYFAHCAQWCAEHPEATRYIVYRTRHINVHENRAASFRLDIEPELAKRAREFGLDTGTYRGVDHNLTADLARYFMATRGLKFRIRKAASDTGATYATPTI